MSIVMLHRASCLFAKDIASDAGSRLSRRSYQWIRHKSTTTTTTGRPHGRPFAFAFDIDGVLLKSSKPIPGARESLSLLREHDIPFILLTNGGGLPEHERVSDLSAILNLEISPSQFIQSHTPFRAHPAAYGYRNILVCGGKHDVCRQVALGYGFPRVTIPLDFVAHDPSIWPYTTLSATDQAYTVPLAGDVGAIDAIYVFHDPRDWGLDSQVIIDTLLERDGKRTMTQQVPIYFSNPDLLWANAYKYPRFGQGAFQLLIEGLFKEVTGKTLQRTTIGKPSRVTYEYADNVLKRFQASMMQKQVDTSPDHGVVYMVGDNKLSDIQGANNFGWESILVKTGVFSGTTAEGLTGDVPARYCVENVNEAVLMVLRKESLLS